MAEFIMGYYEPNDFRAIRRISGYSAADVAKLAGITKQTVCNYERGANTTNSTKCYLSNVLNTMIFDISYDDDKWFNPACRKFARSCHMQTVFKEA